IEKTAGQDPLRILQPRRQGLQKSFSLLPRYPGQVLDTSGGPGNGFELAPTLPPPGLFNQSQVFADGGLGRPQKVREIAQGKQVPGMLYQMLGNNGDTLAPLQTSTSLLRKANIFY